jgi:hypothetical protein
LAEFLNNMGIKVFTNPTGFGGVTGKGFKAVTVEVPGSTGSLEEGGPFGFGSLTGLLVKLGLFDQFEALQCFIKASVLTSPRFKNRGFLAELRERD